MERSYTGDAVRLFVLTFLAVLTIFTGVARAPALLPGIPGLPGIPLPPGVSLPNIPGISNLINLPNFASFINLPNVMNLLNAPGLGNILNLPGLGTLISAPNIGNLLQLPNLNNLISLPNIGNLLDTPGLNNFLASPSLGSLLNQPGLTNLIGSPSLANLLNQPGLNNLLGSANIGNLLNTAGLDNLLGSPMLGNVLNLPNINNLLGAQGLGNLLSQSGLHNLLGSSGLENLLNQSNLSNLLNAPNLGSLLGQQGLDNLLNSANLNKFLSLPNLNEIIALPNLSALLELPQDILDKILARPDLASLLTSPNLGEILGIPGLGNLLNTGSKGAVIEYPPPLSFTNCIAGIPCVTLATPNAPLAPNDGPNVTGPTRKNFEPQGMTCTKDKACGACDADFMNRIYAKAFLETERENILAESTIRKPDSVLAYTCFDQLATIAAWQASPIFSETKRWKNIQVAGGYGGWIGTVAVSTIPVNIYMGPDNPYYTIPNLYFDIFFLVGAAMRDYIHGKDYIDNDGNFDHTFLGGAMDPKLNGSKYKFLEDRTDYKGDYYLCSYMEQVYQLAKCNDYNSDFDFTFETLSKPLDPRTLPQICELSPGKPKPLPILASLITVAKDPAHMYAAFDKDKNTYYEPRLGPGKVLKNPLLKDVNCKDLEPIPTGILYTEKIKKIGLFGGVETNDGRTYQEMVCPIPACFYDREAHKCKP